LNCAPPVSSVPFQSPATLVASDDDCAAVVGCAISTLWFPINSKAPRLNTTAARINFLMTDSYLRSASDTWDCRKSFDYCRVLNSFDTHPEPEVRGLLRPKPSVSQMRISLGVFEETCASLPDFHADE